MFLTGSMLEQVRACGNVITVEPNLETVPSVYNSFNEVFPFKDTEWTRDYYGKIWIPKKGVTVPLSQENLPLYERIIRDYEHNTLEVRDGGTVMINGEKADSYTFRQDYYFMMGPFQFSEEQSDTYLSKGGTPNLDNQYTVFGEVIEGMNVVDKIERASTDVNDRPLKDIRILSAEIIE